MCLDLPMTRRTRTPSRLPKSNDRVNHGRKSTPPKIARILPSNNNKRVIDPDQLPIICVPSFDLYSYYLNFHLHPSI